MARKRLISPQFFLDGHLFDAEQASGLPLRVAYAGLWCFADRRGYLEWKPRELKLGIIPHDAVNMADTMLALCSAGFLKVFEHPDHPGRLFVAIPSFPKWQTFHMKERPDPHIPEPLTKEHLSSTVPAPFQHRASTTGTVTGTGTVTNNLPTTRSRKTPRESLTARETWLTAPAAAWDAINGAGSFPFGKAARFLKPLHDAGHPPEKIAAHLDWYLVSCGDLKAHLKKEDERGWGGFRPNLAVFAETFERWNPNSAVAA